MILYRFGGTAIGIVPDWISEDQRYRNMLAAAGRWFTDDLDEALWYREEHPGGCLWSVEVDNAEAESYRVSNMSIRPGGRDVADNPAVWSARPEMEFFLPRAIADMAAPVAELEKAANQAIRNPGP
jgi:hypothetical protein